MYTTHTPAGRTKSQMDYSDPKLYTRFQMWIEQYTSQITILFCILMLHIEKVVHTMLGARCYTDIHQVCTPKNFQTKGSATQMQKETNKRKAASLEWHQKSTEVVGRVRGCPIPNLALICFLRISWSVSHFFSPKKSSQVNNKTEKKKKSVLLYIHANKQKANKSHH